MNASPIHQQDARQVLRHCAFFDDFSDEDIAVVVQYIDLRTGKQGDVLFYEDEPAEALYIISHGKIELLVNDDHNQPRLVGWLGPSESFGELALLMRGKRLVTVRASNDVTLYELGVASFLKMRAHHPEVCLLIVMAIVKRFSTMVNDNHALFKRILLDQLHRL